MKIIYQGKATLNTLVDTSERQDIKTGTRFFTGTKCYVMTLLALGLVEASGLLN